MQTSPPSDWFTTAALPTLLLSAALALTACSSGDGPAAPGTNGAAGAAQVGGMLDGGGVPLSPPNGVLACPPGACNYQTQHGCKATEACAPALAGNSVKPSCGPAGSKSEGASCAWGDCGAGMFCAEGKCRHLCCGGDWSACPKGQACSESLSIAPTADSKPISAGVGICKPVDHCKPLDPQACPAGRSCQLVDGNGDWTCMLSGSAKSGEACGADAFCSPGYGCYGGTCRRLCQPTTDGQPACPASEGVCVHFVRDPAGIGECTPQGQ